MEESSASRPDLLSSLLSQIGPERPSSRYVLNLYGPVGVGKSTLVEELIHALRGRGYRVARLPMLGLEPRAIDLDLAMTRALSQVEGGHGPLVFVADPLDELLALLPWMARRALDPDRDALGLILATRRPISELIWAELRLMYETLAREVPPLSREESVLLSTSLGVPREEGEQFYSKLGGHPLTLSLVSQEFVARSKSQSPSMNAGESWALGEVTRKLVQRIPSLSHQKGLLVASMLPSLCEGLLGEALGGESPSVVDAVYDWLWQLSFVSPLPFGLVVHDSIRPLILQDAFRHRPKLLSECYRRVHDLLDEQLLAVLERPHELAEKGELVEQVTYLVMHHPMVSPHVGGHLPMPVRLDSVDATSLQALRACVVSNEGERAAAWFDFWLRARGTVFQGIFDAESRLRGCLLLLGPEAFSAGHHGDPVVERILSLVPEGEKVPRTTLARFWFSLSAYQSPHDPWVVACHEALTRLNVALRPRLTGTCHVVDPAYSDLIAQLVQAAGGGDARVEGASSLPCAIAFRSSPYEDNRHWLWRFLWTSPHELVDEPFQKPSTPPPQSEPGSPLSERELSVLRLLSEGYRYEQVAEHMGISLGTTRTYVRRAYAKLGVATKSEATLVALRSGLLK